MSVLLLRLAGPMQAWGTQSRFSIRDTGLEPSKSGVIGLLCAAMGKPRDESLRPDLPALSDLADLRMGVRVDRPGTVQTDYQTAMNVMKADGKRPSREGDPTFTVTSTRYYLADADFLVALEGDDALLTRLDSALADPVWPLFLGRRAFPPTMPVRVPEPPPTDLSLTDALKSRPWWARSSRDRPDGPLRICVEQPLDVGGDTRSDVPVSLLPLDRRFTVRCVRDVELWSVPDEKIKEWPPCTSPDS